MTDQSRAELLAWVDEVRRDGSLVPPTLTWEQFDLLARGVRVPEAGIAPSEAIEVAWDAFIDAPDCSPERDGLRDRDLTCAACARIALEAALKAYDGARGVASRSLASSPSTPEGREPESGEPQELFDALNLLLWHEVRVSNNRDGSVAAALVANRDEARRRVVAMFERASTLREDDAPRPSDEWIEKFQDGYEQRRGYRPEKWMLREIIAAIPGAREDDAGGPAE